MDDKSIQQIIKAMSDSKLTSLEIEYEGVSIKMKKELEKSPEPENKESAAIINEINDLVQSSRKDNTQEQAEVSSKEETNEPKDQKDVKTIVSPIVGTFFASSSPDEEPFVKAGSSVKKGDTLCIIEAMKLMNEIEADEDGIIEEILVQNEKMVEYNQPLFRIRMVN